jgi:hypothetical protein
MPADLEGQVSFVAEYEVTFNDQRTVPERPQFRGLRPAASCVSD